MLFLRLQSPTFFTGVEFTPVKSTGVKFTGVDFTGVKFTGVDFVPDRKNMESDVKDIDAIQRGRYICRLNLYEGGLAL
jgi:uncharacterized protein YjbI with pentapeptide repeats